MRFTAAADGQKSQVSGLAVGKGGARACSKSRPPPNVTQQGGVRKVVPAVRIFHRYVHNLQKVGLTASRFSSAAAADGRITLVLMTLRCPGVSLTGESTPTKGQTGGLQKEAHPQDTS